VGSKEVQEYGWWMEEGKEVKRLKDFIPEEWTKEYKKSINCSNPKGFSQRAHCAGRRKRKRGGQTKSKPV
jgi:hypothetical protein